MGVNYGMSVKRYLLDRVTLLHIHRFDPSDSVQFEDALVSSAVVWFRNERPPKNHEVRMSYGGSLLEPKLERLVPADVLRDVPKWTQYPANGWCVKNSQDRTLSDFFSIKRGIATGNNRYFILPIDEIQRPGLPIEAFRPILPSPRYLPTNEVKADEAGYPVLQTLLKFPTRLPDA